MPRIKNYSFAFDENTADAGLSLVLPENVAGDLLLMFVVADTFSGGTWSPPSGWTTLFSRISTAGVTCCWKISSGSEPFSVLMGASINETYSGYIVAIEDVNQSTPFGSPAVFVEEARSLATSFTLPSITTTVANSLALFLVGHNSLNTVVVDEPLLHSPIMSAGTSEGQNLAWMFCPTIGTVPIVKARSTASNNQTGVVAVLQVAPPDTGATIIPTYIVEDGSGFFAPVTMAVAASQLGVATINTADVSTVFGTTINGVTLGILNSTTRASANITQFFSAPDFNPSSAGANTDMFGISVALSTPKDISGKALTITMAPYSAARAANIAPARGGLGIWLGLASSAGNWKVWQVGGSDMVENTIAHAAYTVDPRATPLASGGTFDPTTLTYIALFLSYQGVSPTSAGQMWSSILVQGPVTLAGGTESRPVSVQEIKKAFLDDKMRTTARLQGTSQLLVSQPIQLGNGSAELYTDLRGSAIEFKAQADIAARSIAYAGVDNYLGLVYCPTASGTVLHSGSVIFSKSRYRWGLHSDASAAATYDFSRLSIIGAGEIKLNKAITVDRLIIGDYLSIDASSAILRNCTISGAPGANDSFVASSTTDVSNCTFDVSGVTAGNRWLSIADPSVISACTFTGGGGHALRLTTPGTYSFSGNMFTGFGADGSDGAAILNDSGGAITLNITGGGGTPTVKNGAGAITTIQNVVAIVLTNVVVGSSYYVFKTNTPVHVYGSGIAVGTTVTISTAYVDDTNITVRIRNASGATKYKPFSTQADLTAVGANVYVSQEVDNVA